MMIMIMIIMMKGTRKILGVFVKIGDDHKFIFAIMMNVMMSMEYDLRLVSR